MRDNPATATRDGFDHPQGHQPPYGFPHAGSTNACLTHEIVFTR